MLTKKSAFGVPNKIILSLLILAMLVCLFAAVGLSAKRAYADDTDAARPWGMTDQISGSAWISNGGDSTLYDALYYYFNTKLNASEPFVARPINAGDFNAISVLDLTPLNNGGKIIKSLDGLEFLFLDSLTMLILDNNGLTSLDSSNFINTNSLRGVSVINNALASAEAPSTSMGVCYLDLSNNKLTSADLTSLHNNVSAAAFNGVDPGTAYCNLSNNNIAGSADVTLPLSTVNLTLDLRGNNIMSASYNDFKGQNVLFGVQGYTQTAVNPQEGNTIAVYDDITADYPDFEVTQYYRSDSQSYAGSAGQGYVAASLIRAVKDDGTTPADYQTLTVAPGKTELKFTDNGTDITGDPFFADITDFNVAPKPPEVSYYDKNGNPISYSSGFNQYVKVAAAGGEGTQISYKLGSNAETKYTAPLEFRSGSTVIYFTAYYDDIASVQVPVKIVVNQPSNIGWVIVILVCLVVVGIAAYFTVTWYRNGAVVAPLSDKETQRMNKTKKR